MDTDVTGRDGEKKRNIPRVFVSLNLLLLLLLLLPSAFGICSAIIYAEYNCCSFALGFTISYLGDHHIHPRDGFNYDQQEADAWGEDFHFQVKNSRIQLRDIHVTVGNFCNILLPGFLLCLFWNNQLIKIIKITIQKCIQKLQCSSKPFFSFDLLI